MITFVGHPKGEHIYVDVLIGPGDEKVTGEPLMLTLDQWQEMLKVSDRNGDFDEPIFWATTRASYERTRGEPMPV